MSRRALALTSLLSSVALASVFVACAGLKHADEAADAGGAEAGDESDVPIDEDGGVDGAAGDSAAPDAGPPPVDFACDGDVWTKATKTKAECAPRQVKVVDTTGPIDVRGISIARTPAGRVGIVYNSEDAVEGAMHLLHFTPTTPTYAAPKLVKKATGQYFHDGYLTKLAASPPDTLAVLAYDMDDSTYVGEVHLRSLVAGKEPLTDDLVVAAVKSPTEIAVATDAVGNVYATVRISTGATTAKLAAWKKTGAGAFAVLPDITTSLLPDSAPGIGSASLLVDPGGQANLLYHHSETAQHSTPRYHTLAGTTWSYRKTVDNAVIDGLSGYSPRIAVFGTKKYAAYFFRKAGQTPATATADLRLATWDSSMDTPQIEILDQQIPSPLADLLAPAYSVAMAVDKFGLVHLAIVRPSTSKVGYVEYRRQTRLASGTTKWLSDLVDDDVISEVSQAFVDMVVDENARPHIAYRSAKDGNVKYATRFDR